MSCPHRPIFVNIQDNHNLGDMLCSASGLFPEFSAAPVDFRSVTDGPEPLIVGGGGLLHPGIDKWIHQQACRRPVILLGVGLNYHLSSPPAGWEDLIKPCLCVGLRDKSVAADHPRFSYCPCPTTGLIPWNDLRAESRGDRYSVVFEHYDYPIVYPGSESVERRTNRWFAGGTLEEVAKSLGRFKRVLTNTYHGALWSLRMGCEVVLWRPFSTRFSTGLPCRLPAAHSAEDLDACWTVWQDERYRRDVNDALQKDFAHLDAFREEVRTIIS